MHFQSEKRFHSTRIPQAADRARWASLTNFKCMIVESGSAVTNALMATIFAGLVFKNEQHVPKALNSPHSMLLGSLLLFMHLYQVQSSAEVVSGQRRGNRIMIFRLPLSLLISITWPTPYLQADPPLPLGTMLTMCVLLEASRMHMMSALLRSNHNMRWTASAAYLAWILAQVFKLQSSVELQFHEGKFFWGGYSLILNTVWLLPLVFLLPLWFATMRTTAFARRKDKHKIHAQRTVSVGNTLVESMLSSIMLPPRLSELAASPLSTSSLWMEEFPRVTVCFVSFSRTDFERFENPQDFLLLIGHCISMFDQVVTEQGLFKLEHVGEDYVVTSSCVRDGPDSLSQRQHEQETVNLVKLAQVLLDVSKKITVGESKLSLQFRAGLHSGPCVGAIAGKDRRFYRLFGDSVNTAARMCQHAPPGGVHLSQSVFDLVKGYDLNLMERGVTSIKGKGPMPTFVSLRHWVLPEVRSRDEDLSNELDSSTCCAGEVDGDLNSNHGLAAKSNDNSEQSADPQTAVYTGLRTVDDKMSKDGSSEPAECCKAERVGLVPEQQESIEKNNLKDPEKAETSSLIPEAEVKNRQSVLPSQSLRASSFSSTEYRRRSSFQQPALAVLHKTARFERLNGVSVVRRSASFTFGCVNKRALDLGLEHDQREASLTMADIKTQLQECFPQSMQDELNEIMSAAMEVDIWEGELGVGVGDAQFDSSPRDALEASASWRPPPANPVPAFMARRRTESSLRFPRRTTTSFSSSLAEQEPSFARSANSTGETWMEISSSICSTMEPCPALDLVHEHDAAKDDEVPGEMQPPAQPLQGSSSENLSSDIVVKTRVASTAVPNTLVEALDSDMMSVQKETAETVEQGTTQASCAASRHKVKRRSSLSELWNGLSQSVQTKCLVATDSISKTLADTALLGFSTEHAPGGLAGGAVRLRVKTSQGGAASPEKRLQALTKGRFASRKLARTVSARVINLTPRASLPKTPTVMSALGRRLTRKSEPGCKTLELNRRRTESIDMDRKADSMRRSSYSYGDSQSNFSNNGMSQLYRADLLEFCEKFSARSRTSPLMKKRPILNSITPEVGLGPQDMLMSCGPGADLVGAKQEVPDVPAPGKSNLQEYLSHSGNPVLEETDGIFQSRKSDHSLEALATKPIMPRAHFRGAERCNRLRRASLIESISMDNELKVWKSLQEESRVLHSTWLCGFRHEKIERCFVLSSLQQDQPYLWPMAVKVGLYAALAVNLWQSLPASLSLLTRALASAVLVVAASAARVPLAAAVPDSGADPSWTRVVPVGVAGMLLEALQPQLPPLSLTAYTLLVMMCDTFVLQTPSSILVMLAAFATPLMGEILRTGVFWEVVLSMRALLLFALASVFYSRLRIERRQARVFWQVQCSLNKRNRKLCSVWYDLVPSVSAREFIFKRRMWMEFSAFNEETMLERYSLWVQVDRSHAVVLAMDMVNFTPLANSLTPCQVVCLLHEIWCLVDECVRDPSLGKVGGVKDDEQNTMFKMDTIGDAYITVHLVEADSREAQATAVERVMQLAVNIRSELLALSVWKSSSGELKPDSLRFRMGLSSDSVVAGVVGLLQPRYHVFGTAVENARHLESQAGGGMLHVQDNCVAMLPWLHGKTMVDLEKFNHEDIPALLEMNAMLTDHQDIDRKETARPAICRPLADYIDMKE